MVAGMGDVFALEYNFHVPLYFEGQAVRTRGWLYVTMFFFLLLVCWLFFILWFFSYSGFFYWRVCSSFAMVWCGVVCLGCWWSLCMLWCHTCSSISSIIVKLTYDSNVA
jgi:hypothetical protein